MKKKANVTAYDRVKIARDAKRPHIFDFIKAICSDFEELHGDRLVNDDQGLIGGFATIDADASVASCGLRGADAPVAGCGLRVAGNPQPSTLNSQPSTHNPQPSTLNPQPSTFRVLILGHHKGATVEENMAANFGMANPDGYRKAMRLAKLAEKFHLPVVTFVDTPGAYPGDTAEARGQAEAIAKSLEFFAALKTPVVVVVTGEGGSGGALAIAVGDRILMLENAVYSVISPEGCAGILWRDGAKAPEAAAALKITAADLKRLGVIDEIIPERNLMAGLKKAIVAALKELKSLSVEDLLDRRYAKFTAMGRFR